MAITTDLPRAYGEPVLQAQYKQRPEDFQVIELPAVTPSGEGEHLWLWIEKTGLNTLDVAKQLAAWAQVPLRQISYAGLKDKQAQSQQYFSIHLPGRPDPQPLQAENWRILHQCRHQRKLRRGTLKGNRFIIRLRQVKALGDWRARLQQIADQGLANYFMEQRFGHQNLERARALLSGGLKKIKKAQKSFYLSAMRADLFNRVLAQRLQAGLWQQLLLGDVAQLDGRSALFLVNKLDHQLKMRFQQLQIHATAPLCGQADDLQAQGQALAIEQAALAEQQHWIDALARFGLKQARRPLRVRVQNLRASLQGDDLELCFELPAGSYATALLRELIE